jgi:lipoteichoic acid synthase
MIKATTSDYLDSTEPFMVYYMTVSGHLAYNFGGNMVAIKNRGKVNNLPYSDSVKAYLATQIELNDALELLIKNLEEKNKLDDTVIVLLADHYPYGLTVDQINEISNYKKDGIIGVNDSNLIIWNSKMKTIEVDKVSMSIDVLPTVYNLFGIDYDSRLFAGSDILSTREGMAIFNERSWVTDKGKYFGSSNNFVQSEEIDGNYIKTINNIMNNKISISKLIVKNNYYDYLKNNGVFNN